MQQNKLSNNLVIPSAANEYVFSFFVAHTKQHISPLSLTVGNPSSGRFGRNDKVCVVL